MTITGGSYAAHEGDNLVFWNGKGYVSRQTLITTDTEGNEVRWLFDGQLEANLDCETQFSRREARNQDRQRASAANYHIHESEQCMWPIASDWRHGQCGRNGTPVDGGLTLCWQHEDAVFSDTLTRLEQRKLTPQQVERLICNLLNAQKQNGWAKKYSRIKMSPLIEAQAENYLRDLADGKYIDPDIEAVLDELIERRIQEKWGSECLQ